MESGTSSSTCILGYISICPPLQSSAQKELEESWQVYAELQRMVEQSQAELVEAIATKQREAERHAQELARGLENELSQLKRRSNELEAQAQMQDRVLFLQVLTSNLSRVSGPKKCTKAINNQVRAMEMEI